MKRLAALAAAALLGGCTNPDGTPRTFANNDLQLAVGNGARLGCSCVFVMKMTDEFCLAWVKASPDVTKLSIDRSRKRVTAAALVTWAATASYVDEQTGCVIE